MILEFQNIAERKGSDIIISNIAKRFLRSFAYSHPTTESTEWQEIPQQIIDTAQSHPDWQRLEEIGKSQMLKELVESLDDDYQKAADKDAFIEDFKQKVNELL